MLRGHACPLAQPVSAGEASASGVGELIWGGRRRGEVVLVVFVAGGLNGAECQPPFLAREGGLEGPGSRICETESLAAAGEQLLQCSCIRCRQLGKGRHSGAVEKLGDLWADPLDLRQVV